MLVNVYVIQNSQEITIGKSIKNNSENHQKKKKELKTCVVVHNAQYSVHVKNGGKKTSTIRFKRTMRIYAHNTLFQIFLFHLKYVYPSYVRAEHVKRIKYARLFLFFFVISTICLEKIYDERTQILFVHEIQSKYSYSMFY